MKIPRYWRKHTLVVDIPGNRKMPITCFGWSDDSPEAAQSAAFQTTQRAAQRLATGSDLRRYDYTDRPLREEIKNEVKNRFGQTVGLVTRNAYGALVLNTAQAMFIDIDFEEQPHRPSLGALFSGILGQKAARPDPTAPAMQRLERWVSQNPGIGLRVYRTYGGLRGLITTDVFDPCAASSLELLKNLGSDPLYIRLCAAQACFRARLTPKPWRCKVRRPPNRYPWDSSAQETRYRHWEAEYQSKTYAYSTGRLLKWLGVQQVHPDIEASLALHDEMCQITSGRSLA